MKKYISAAAAGILALTLGACSSTSGSTAASTKASVTTEAAETASAESETEDATYTITNNTGEKVTELYIYKDASDKGDNYAGEEGLEDGKKVEVTLKDLNKDEDSTLEYVTESGRDEKFETLHVETVPISLLAEDAMTGSTPISFSAE